MTTKNYGPSTSGYLDPDGRNWETVVLQAGKPVLDREINLIEDIDVHPPPFPSGWLSGDFTSSANHASGVFLPSVNANQLSMPQGMRASVNGWGILIAHTNVLGGNELVLDPPPVGGGTRRTDIVVLEVWRKLISASPSADGKSASGRIWQQGNVKTSPADDLTLNFADDLLDVNVGSETTKRVQIQYRLRAISNVDLFTFPYGLDDPTVFANSVPTGAGVPDGVATTFTYANQSAAGDPGLWRAGDGNPANTLGTVDGYMYAIPLLGVFRRNSAGFDRNLNQNGAVASPGPSDRPDGLLADVLDARDIIDLRFGVSPTGWSYAEILEKNVNYLFDNNLRTEITLTPNGFGMAGHTFLWADEIGVSNAHGGTPPLSGDTAGGEFIGEFDSVRRIFSDRATYEVMTVKVPAPGGAWNSTTSFQIDFTSVEIYPGSAMNWASYAPSAVVVQDVLGARWMGYTAGKQTQDATAYLTKITNLGAVPVGLLTIDYTLPIATPPTDEDLYVDLLICYPNGVGLSHTPTASYGANSFSINNPGALPADYSALANTAIDAAHREVQVEYTTTNVTFTVAADVVVNNKSTIDMPERVDSVVSILKNGSPIVGTATISANGRVLTLTNAADYTNPGDTLDVTYSALRPLPQNGEQITIWYEARAPQTARDPLLGPSLSLIPRYVSQSLYVITAGPASQDEGYPFPTAYAQTGGIYPGSTGTYNGEMELSTRALVSVADFTARTGFLKLPVFVPFVANPESLTFNRTPAADIDIEGRTFFKSVPGGSYLPNAFAQDLSDPKKHKVVLPMIAELTADSSLGLKGQLVMLVLTRWAVFDETNGVFFDANLIQNTTTASVFRIKGNLLNRSA